MTMTTNEHLVLNLAFANATDDDKRALIMILEEAKRAREKHPEPPKDYVHAAAVVAEESGELVRAALQREYEKGTHEDMRTEAVQTGATVLRFLSEWA